MLVLKELLYGMKVIYYQLAYTKIKKNYEIDKGENQGEKALWSY